MTLADQAAAFADADLPAEYEATDAEPGDDWYEALLKEIERRGLDI